MGLEICIWSVAGLIVYTIACIMLLSLFPAKKCTVDQKQKTVQMFKLLALICGPAVWAFWLLEYYLKRNV